MTHPDPFSADPTTTSRWISDRQRLLRHEAEDALRAEILDYTSRQEEYWQRDYSSVDAYVDSVRANRERWAEAIGVVPHQDRPFEARLEPWFEDDHMQVWWLTVDFLGSLQAHRLSLPSTESVRHRRRSSASTTAATSTKPTAAASSRRASPSWRR